MESSFKSSHPHCAGGHAQGMKIRRVNKRYESWEERKYFRDKIVSPENVNASADSLELMSERDRITDTRSTPKKMVCAKHTLELPLKERCHL